METRFGSFEVCDRVVQLVLAKDVYVFYYYYYFIFFIHFRICELKPCSFNGVYQPSLLDSSGPNDKVLRLL